MYKNSLSRRNFKGLQLDSSLLSKPQENELPVAPDVGLSGPGARDRLQRMVPINQMKGGDDIEFHRIDSSDLEMIGQLGFGNSGTVSKVRHKVSGLQMAKKMIHLEADEKSRRLMVNELSTLKICDSENIVKYYGQFIEHGQVVICMEFMDCGSLDKIYKHTGSLPEKVLQYVNAAVVDGLVYLKDLQVTHRDIKPSNILVNRNGDIKLCDFGVSGVLINSMAQTYVGTSVYMSPERIQGEEYTDAGDVWSLGLSLVEMAWGKFPIMASDDEDVPAAPFEILQSIVDDPAPELPDNASPMFKEYVSWCLRKDAKDRIKVRLLAKTPFYLDARRPDSVNPLPMWASTLTVL